MLTRTPQRQYLEETLLPSFAGTFPSDAVVLNIGAGRHAYREHFRCPVWTGDILAGCDVRYAAERMPYADNSVDGVVFNGVFERLDDPMQAMREIYRVLKPSGAVLFGAPGLDCEWHSNKERWRLTPAGFAHVIRDFRVMREQSFGRAFSFYVLEKPTC